MSEIDLIKERLERDNPDFRVENYYNQDVRFLLAALAEKERDCIYKECISCNEVIEPFEAYVHKGVKPLCKKCYEERAAQKEGV